MIKAGDVVVDFPGATGIKRRPAVVLSSEQYHRQRPDLILGVITSNVVVATTSTDYVLQDWSAAGLDRLSAFRAYFAMAESHMIRIVGHLSQRDWLAVKECVTRALG